MEFHFFELPKFGKGENELAGGIEEWLYFLRHAEMMDVAAVPAALQRPPILQAFGVLEMVSKSEIERLRYEESGEAERWLEHNLRAREQRGIQIGQQIGRQEGEKIGRQEGEKIGRQIGKIQLLERFLGRPETSVEALGERSPAELDQMIAELQQQFQNARS